MQPALAPTPDPAPFVVVGPVAVSNAQNMTLAPDSKLAVLRQPITRARYSHPTMAFADVAKFLRAVLNDEFEFKLTGKAPHESLQITGPADSQLALDLFLFALDGRGRETGNKHNESGPADEPRPEVQGIPVSRVLYRLPADRCTTLKTFLSEQFPDEVDVRTKGETLQITASPDVQRAIGELIRLMQKKGRSQADVTVQPPASEEPNNPRSPAAPLDDRDQS